MQNTSDNRMTAISHKNSEISLRETDIMLLERCEPHRQVRRLKNSLYSHGERTSELAVSRIEYTPLTIERNEARLLVLHPTDDDLKHIRCNLEVHPLTDLPPFIAVQNARGYRSFEEAIEIDGKAQLISLALERFLRYLRTRIEVPTRVWVRYACLLEFNPQEQTVYWTREYSDNMYALATQLFDMHEVNNRLIENGYFENPVDLRYATHNKEWYGMPSEIVLPGICPVRLGTKPDNDAPTMHFQYMPLDMFANEIRIICVMPAADTVAPVVIHVAHCPIKCEVTFVALSCKWTFNESSDCADGLHIRLLGNRCRSRESHLERTDYVHTKEPCTSHSILSD